MRQPPLLGKTEKGEDVLLTEDKLGVWVVETIGKDGSITGRYTDPDKAKALIYGYGKVAQSKNGYPGIMDDVKRLIELYEMGTIYLHEEKIEEIKTKIKFFEKES